MSRSVSRAEIKVAAAALNDAHWWDLVTPEAVARIVLEATRSERSAEGSTPAPGSVGDGQEGA